MRITILSTSFRRPSLTLTVAQHIADRFASRSGIQLLDAADLGRLPLVGVDAAEDPAFEGFARALADADAVIVGAPVYRASMSGAAKGLVDFFGDAFANKPVGVFVAAGGPGAHLATADLDRPLAIDLGCPTSPTRLLVTSVSDGEFDERLDRFVERFEWFARANRVAVTAG